MSKIVYLVIKEGEEFQVYRTFAEATNSLKYSDDFGHGSSRAGKGIWHRSSEGSDLIVRVDLPIMYETVNHHHNGGRNMHRMKYFDDMEFADRLVVKILSVDLLNGDKNNPLITCEINRKEFILNFFPIVMQDTYNVFDNVVRPKLMRQTR